MVIMDSSRLNELVNFKLNEGNCKPGNVINKSHYYIKVKSIGRDGIVITLDLAEATTSKIRYYLHQCGKEDHDDLGAIAIKSKRKSGIATIDLEDIDDKRFNIALYANQHDTNPISNILSFYTKMDNIYEINQYNSISNICSINECSTEDEYSGMYHVS
eukprot:833012_1